MKQSRMDRIVTRLVYAQRRRVVGAPVRVLLWLFGVEIPRQVEIGPGLVLAHPTTGIAVHPRTRIGSNVSLFHGVTIGRANPWEPETVKSRVTVEDGAIIGAGATVLFTPGRDLIIGAGAIVGANSVVTTNVGPGEVWVGNPAKPRPQGREGLAGARRPSTDRR